ncbi:MAG: hypothetical protein M3O90_04715, partial [Actinomycetota bacterium]|nr:hypothetical protein [Actinomycetota bacterium]
GVPDRRRPDHCSCRATDSAVLRMTTRRGGFGDVRVSFRLRIDRLLATSKTPARAWDGVNVFLRWRSERELYALAIQRRDGRVALKRKQPSGNVNGGRYTTIAEARGPRLLDGRRHAIRATVTNRPGGKVAVTLDVDGRQVLAGVDGGADGPALVRPGRVGLRADNTEFDIDDVRVEPIG